jgi:hypothetical protein
VDSDHLPEAPVIEGAMKEHRFSWILACFEPGYKCGPPSSLHQNHPRERGALACLDSNLRGQVSRSDLNQPIERPFIACDKAESFPLSPTREQVDAYIRLLDWQIERQDVGLPLLCAEKRRPAGSAVQRWVSTVLFCAMVAFVLGCSAWLLQLIYEAFN